MVYYSELGDDEFTSPVAGSYKSIIFHVWCNASRIYDIVCGRNTWDLLLAVVITNGTRREERRDIIYKDAAIGTLWFWVGAIGLMLVPPCAPPPHHLAADCHRRSGVIHVCSILGLVYGRNTDPGTQTCCWLLAVITSGEWDRGMGQEREGDIYIANRL